MPNARETFLSELQVSQLPSLPHVLVDLLHACQNPDSSFQDISVIIHRDTAIVARVVVLANAPFYNRGVKINSVERALLVLGTETIKTIVITAAVQQFFSHFSHSHAAFLKRFWKRSLSCALLAKSLAILTSYPNPEEAYLGGLLHNIGELILNTNFDQRYGQLCKDYPDEAERIAHETETFSLNHCAIGAWLIKEWDLSPFISDAIEFHHAASDLLTDAHHLVKVVALSSLLSTDESLLEAETFAVADTLFELNASLVSEITRKIQSEVIGIAQSMSIQIADTGDADQAKQIELAKQIRNISLLQTAKSELGHADASTELDVALKNTLALLFGFKQSAVFWHDPTANELSFLLPETGESHVPIRFKMEPQRSLIAQAALDRQIICSMDPARQSQPLPVVDQQICRFFSTPGLLCIPVFDESGVYCVIVAGVNADLPPQSTLRQRLRYFSHEAAKSCRATRTASNRNEEEAQVHTLAYQASVIAHEANNPLSIIANYLSALSGKLSDNTEVQQELSILREEVERTGKILHRLTDLRHVAIDNGEHADINREINSLVTLYKSSIFLSHGTRCTLDLDPELKTHHISSHSLRQILTNLLKNAVEALPHDGEITLATRHCVNVDGKDYVEILVQDNGPGIPEHILRNLFKPVTSTKGGKHSGLGLSITRNLVKDAKGTIRCRSGRKGTEFQILLPGGEQE